MPLETGKHKMLVTHVQANASNYSGRNGVIYKHIITFANGSTGEYHTSKPEQSDFIPGQEIEFECNVTTNGQYTNYKIKPVKAGGNFGKSSFSPNSSLGIAALNAALEIYKKGDIPKDSLQNVTKNFYDFLKNLTQ